MQLAEMPTASTTSKDVVGPALPLHELPPSELRDWLGRCGDRYVRLLPVDHAASATVPLWVCIGMAEDTRIPIAALTSIVDLAERIVVALAFEQHEHQLVQQARLDPLTGLPNRLAAYEELGTQIAATAAGGAGFATAFLDLDRFKSINDGLGHAFGDELLGEIARRISGAVSPGTFVARLGGDEFFLILPGVTSRADATEAVQRLKSAFDLPVEVGQREFQQKFSMGIAFHPTDGADPATLIRAADMAMYQVKRNGGGDSAFYQATMNTAAQRRLRMENELRAAITDRRIKLHYQPRVDSRSGQVVGLEALARWIQPDGVAVPPSEFIGLAEDCGFIDDLGEMVIDDACRQLAAWRTMNLNPPRIGVNVSGHQLASGALVPILAAALARWGVPPECLEIEVTETALMRDSESGGRQLQAARELGVQVAIDDFGTGYSSLAYLASLPSDTLKIDRAFVVEFSRGDQAAAAVVRFIIGIARDLGKTVVAEGVESMDQVHSLAAWGCHTIQGYVYARPLPADEVTQLLAEGGVLRPVLCSPE
jgi:diguanylate cyclase (GGDEF)-like protein